MSSEKESKKQLIFGIISITAPIFAIIFIFYTSYFLASIIPIVIGIVMGIKGIRSEDRKAKTLSIIGLIFITLELTLRKPLIFLTFQLDRLDKLKKLPGWIVIWLIPLYLTKKPSRAGGTRTHKTLLSEDFKSSASAKFRLTRFPV